MEIVWRVQNGRLRHPAADAKGSSQRFRVRSYRTRTERGAGGAPTQQRRFLLEAQHRAGKLAGVALRSPTRTQRGVGRSDACNARRQGGVPSNRRQLLQNTQFRVGHGQLVARPVRRIPATSTQGRAGSSAAAGGTEEEMTDKELLELAAKAAALYQQQLRKKHDL